MPEQNVDAMLQEEIALQYNSVETLKLRCLEKVMQLNDSSVLVNVIHTINDYLFKNEPPALTPYTIEELQKRTDEAYAELEAGKGKDGELFFSELDKYIMSK